VNAVALQSDGQVLIGGTFTSVSGISHLGIARLNSNGGLDNGYNPILSLAGSVNAVAVQTNDKVLIGGTFTTVNGTNRARIARLNTDGTIDNSFNPGSGANAVVRSIVVQTNGRVIIVGDFTSFNGTNLGAIARLNDDGSLDNTFNTGTGLTQGFPTQGETVALQDDGKVLVGGRFDVCNGKSVQGIARLNPDGSLDTNFHTANLIGSGIRVYSVAPQPDGKVIMGGEFTVVNGTNSNHIARLNTNGSLDTTFNPGAGCLGPSLPYVYSVVVQPDTEVIIVGGFTSVNRSARWYVARLFGDAPLINPGSTSASSNSINLQWAAIPGRTYRVQYKEDLAALDWSNLPPDVVAISNTASTSYALTNANRFYRVSLLP